MRLQPESLGDAGPVARVGARTVFDMPMLHMQPCVSHGTRGVVEEGLLLGRCHHPEQVAWLLPMVILDAVVPMRRIALDRQRRLREIGLVVPKSCTVGIVSERSAQIAVGAHLAVAMVALERAFGGIDRDVVEIDTEPIAL